MKKKRMTKKRASELFRKVFGIYAGMVMVSCRWQIKYGLTGILRRKKPYFSYCVGGGRG